MMTLDEKQELFLVQPVIVGNATINRELRLTKGLIAALSLDNSKLISEITSFNNGLESLDVRNIFMAHYPTGLKNLIIDILLVNGCVQVTGGQSLNKAMTMNEIDQVVDRFRGVSSRYPKRSVEHNLGKVLFKNDKTISRIETTNKTDAGRHCCRPQFYYYVIAPNAIEFNFTD